MLTLPMTVLNAAMQYRLQPANGSRWSDVPVEYGPAKTLYNRYKRWSEAGVFERVFEALARENADFQTLMIDATHVKSHRIAANGVKKSPAMAARSDAQKAG